MNNGNKRGISLVALILIIIVVGLVVYMVCNKIINGSEKKNAEVATSESKQVKNNEENDKLYVNNTIDKEDDNNDIDTNNQIDTNTVSNDILDEEDDEVNYLSLEDVLKIRSQMYNEYPDGDKYALVDIDNDGYDDFLYYDVLDKDLFDMYVYRGTPGGFNYVNNPVGGDKTQELAIKEAGTDYLTLIYIDDEYETIEHYSLTGSGYNKTKVVDHAVEEGQEYDANGMIDTIQWKNIK